jgi:hypothetical protein
VLDLRTEEAVAPTIIIIRRAAAAALLALAPSTSLEAQNRAPTAPAWRIVYKHDGEGRPIGGSKQALIDAVRAGQEVRVAWGVRDPRDSTRSVEHTALSVFTTVVNGNEVFVQVAEHVAVADYWERESQDVGDPRVSWVGTLGTTGRFNAVWYNRATGEEARRLPQRATITWMVTPAVTRGRSAPPPLYESTR